jgi:hypothetical protein
MRMVIVLGKKDSPKFAEIDCNRIQYTNTVNFTINASLFAAALSEIRSNLPNLPVSGKPGSKKIAYKLYILYLVPVVFSCERIANMHST